MGNMFGKKLYENATAQDSSRSGCLATCLVFCKRSAQLNCRCSNSSTVEADVYERYWGIYHLDEIATDLD